MTSNSQYLCGMPLQELYLDDPGNTNQPANYALCSDSGNACDESGCHCRHGATVSIDGSKVFIGICELVGDGTSCSSASSSKVIDCGSFDSSSSSTPTATGSTSDSDSGKKSSSTGKTSVRSADSSSTEDNSGTLNESREAKLTPAASAGFSGTKQTSATSSSGGNGQATATPVDSSFSTAHSSGSAKTKPASISNIASSSSPVNTPVIAAIIVVCVVFVALVAWFVRRYCAKKVAADKAKMATHSAPSPTNTSGGSFATPLSYPPSIDHRIRSMDSGNGVFYERRSSRAAGVSGETGANEAWVNGYGDVVPSPAFGQSGRQMNSAPRQFEGYNTHDQVSPFAQPPGFRIDESQVSLGYPDVSWKGGRSIAPSAASSATTAVVPGRRRPSSKHSKRRQQLAHSIAPSVASTATTVAMPGRRRQTKGSQDRRQLSNGDRSGSENGFEASVASDATSAWSTDSGDDYIPPFRLLRQQQSGNY